MTADEGPLSPDEVHEVLAIARDAGADMGRSQSRRLQARAEQLIEAPRVRAFSAADRSTQFEGVAKGYWMCPVVVIDVGEVRSRPWPLHLVEEAPVPEPCAPASSTRPGVHEVPTLADMATAEALVRLRPGGADWMSLPASARYAQSLAAMPLRRALIASGWTPPTKES